MREKDQLETVLFELEGFRFEWNVQKAESNRTKHRVEFEEAATVFLDERAIFLEDVEHSADEARTIVLGKSKKKQTLAVVHLERRERFRIISARRATKRERRDYESS